MLTALSHQRGATARGQQRRDRMQMIRATVKVAGQQRERRFPANTPKRIIKAWKKQELGQLEKRHPAKARAQWTPGTIAADIVRYLPQKKELASWKDHKALINAWIEFIGDKNRGAVTREDVLVARGIWIERGD